MSFLPALNSSGSSCSKAEAAWGHLKDKGSPAPGTPGGNSRITQRTLCRAVNADTDCRHGNSVEAPRAAPPACVESDSVAGFPFKPSPGQASPEFLKALAGCTGAEQAHPRASWVPPQATLCTPVLPS